MLAAPEALTMTADKTNAKLKHGYTLAYLSTGDVDTNRTILARGSLGQEMYTLVYDRIGAQSLPDDVTGASFHGIYHANERSEFAESVDSSRLPGLEATTDRTGRLISIEELSARRDYPSVELTALVLTETT